MYNQALIEATPVLVSLGLTLFVVWFATLKERKFDEYVARHEDRLWSQWDNDEELETDSTATQIKIGKGA